MCKEWKSLGEMSSIWKKHTHTIYNIILINLHSEKEKHKEKEIDKITTSS
jgi:hypothetical protein